MEQKDKTSIKEDIFSVIDNVFSRYYEKYYGIYCGVNVHMTPQDTATFKYVSSIFEDMKTGVKCEILNILNKANK